jgi:hypothetical protein
VFFAGGVGSHGPRAGAPGFAGAERMGQALAQLAAQRLAEIPLTNSVAFAMLGLDVSLPELNVRLSDGWRLRPLVSRQFLHVQDRTFLQVLRLGQSLWVSTPCDFSGELALDIKNFLHRRGLQTTVTSFNGDYVGYVIPARYYHLGGYEPRTMSFFGPCVPDYFNELIRGLSLCVAE